MLADSRSRALSTRFAAQWLRLQDVDKVRPDGLLFPRWDATLSEAFVRETELFFDSLVRENRSALESDHGRLHVRERAARAALRHSERHGSQFRRVPLPEPRRGLLTHGSVLLLTSVADRTSPVQRGKWVLQVLLGSPPPPPPPMCRRSRTPRDPPTAGSCRCESAWSSTGRTPRACRVIA